MKYQTPLVLLTDEQIQLYHPDQIKRIRKEVLLQFQLTSKPYIKVGGRKWDMQTVLNQLDEIQVNFEIHKYIYEHKLLLRFLETNDLRLFKDKTLVASLRDLPESLLRIQLMVIDSVNATLPNIILQFTYHTTHQVQGLFNYTKDLSGELQQRAYLDTESRLTIFVKYLFEKFPAPYESEKSYRFHPELNDVISEEFVHFFSYLPDYFQRILRDYCKWCNNCVVVGAYEKQDAIGLWPRTTYQLTRVAAIIASRYFFPEQNLDAAADMNRRIHQYVRVPPRIWILSFLFGCYLLYAVFVFITPTPRRTDPAPQNPPIAYYGKDPIGESEIYQELSHDKQMLDLIRSAAYTALSSDSVVKKFNHQMGYTAMALGSEGSTQRKSQDTKKSTIAHPRGLISVLENSSFTKILYEVESFPTDVGNFTRYIPDTIQGKYKNQDREFLLLFRRKYLPEITFGHRMRVRFDHTAEILKGAFIVKGDKPVIVPHPLPKEKYRFAGFITHTDAKGKSVQTASIRIHADSSSTMWIEVDPWKHKTEVSPDARTKSLQHLLQILNGHRIDPVKLSHIPDALIYRFDLTEGRSFIKMGLSASPASEHDIQVDFLFKSAIDQMIYLSATHGNTQIKWMYSGFNSYLHGLEVITSNQSKSYEERIELYRVAW